MEPVIGIDLGTTFSVAAYVTESGEPKAIPDSKGNSLLPSVVSIGDSGAILIGDEAKHQRVVKPTLTISSVKRLMGKGSREMDLKSEYIPYSVDLSDEKIVRIKLGEKWLTPPEISALVLKNLKERAELFFKTPVKSAVITVPAYFNDSQRQATKDAGKIAGFNVMRIINEPTAASLAYGLHKKNRGKIAVYDFGGGTFDISILNLHDGIFEVLSTAGDTHLGGDDIDWKLAQIIMEKLGKQTENDPELTQLIVETAEKTKIELSTENKSVIQIKNAKINFEYIVTRQEFEVLMKPIIERTIKPCKQAIKDAGLSLNEIDEVILVGGSTRMPIVRKMVEDTFHKRPHCELNPDEVVALGAAVQAHILTGQMKDMLLLDVTPLSLGIETYGGAVARIIERNSTIPARANDVFTTFVDGQTSVDIHILQGERELAKDCRSLAKFQLKGIDPMTAGMARIEVTFLIDENGILQAKAKDQRSGKEQSIEVKPTYGLTEQEIQNIVQESYANAKEDFDAHLLIDVKNEADLIIRATEKALKEAGSALSKDEKKKIEGALQKLKSEYSENDRKKIKDTTEGLNKITEHLAEIMMNEVLKKAMVGKKVDHDG